MKLYITAVLLVWLTSIGSAQTEVKIPIDSLPSAAKTHLNSKFKHYRIAKIMKITDKALAVTYNVEARKDENTNTITSYELIYDKQGVLKSKNKTKEYVHYETEPPRPKPEPHKPNDGHNH